MYMIVFTSSVIEYSTVPKALVSYTAGIVKQNATIFS